MRPRVLAWDKSGEALLLLFKIARGLGLGCLRIFLGMAALLPSMIGRGLGSGPLLTALGQSRRRPSIIAAELGSEAPGASRGPLGRSIDAALEYYSLEDWILPLVTFPPSGLVWDNSGEVLLLSLSNSQTIGF